MYGKKYNETVEIFRDGTSLGVNSAQVSHWVEVLSQTPRVASLLAKNPNFISALQNVIHSFHQKQKKEI